MTDRKHLLVLVSLILIACFSAAPPATAGGLNRYVSETGSDAGPNDCLAIGSPCLTIAHAIDQAGTDDFINIAAGKYKENLDLSGPAPQTLTFRGGWDATFSTFDPVANLTILTGGKTDRALRIVTTSTNRIVTLIGLTIEKSKAKTPDSDGDAAGGAILAESFGSTTLQLFLDRVIVSKNKAKAKGGALRLVVEDSSSMTTTITDSTFSKNKGKEEGGAIETDVNTNGSMFLQIVRTFFEKNQSKTGGGGAISAEVRDSADLDIDLSSVIFHKNRAKRDGGAIQSESDNFASYALQIDNGVFLKNRSNDDGGALSLENFGLTSPTLDSPNSTFSANRARDKGGAVNLESTSGSPINAAFLNDILWGNRAKNAKDVNLSGNVSASMDHCDIGDISAAFTDLGGNVDVDPMLVNAVAGDGHLQSGSPMIDAGNCSGAPSTDMDGEVRPKGATCDIGADEF